MKATLVERTGDHATVRLTPSWLARLLGARVSVCELEYSHGFVTGDSRSRGWWAAGSGRPLSHVSHSALIEDALDFVPAVPPDGPRRLPVARTVSR